MCAIIGIRRTVGISNWQHSPFVNFHDQKLAHEALLKEKPTEPALRKETSRVLTLMKENLIFGRAVSTRKIQCKWEYFAN